jgi:hypothetical protein
MAHDCNSSYLRSWHREDHSSRPGQPRQKKKVCEIPISTEKKLGMVAYACDPSYGREHKTGGLWSRAAWAKVRHCLTFFFFSTITRAKRAGGEAQGNLLHLIFIASLDCIKWPHGMIHLSCPDLCRYTAFARGLNCSMRCFSEYVFHH